MSSLSLGGFVPAAVTPFGAAGELMEEALARLLAWYVANGADGLCVAGNNGEAWSLSPDERRRLARAAVAAARGRIPVIMGASATSAKATIANAEIAAEAGVDAIMISPQANVGRATTAELVARFEAVHRAVALPIVAFNAVRYTGINLEPDHLGLLIDAAGVVGVKESSRDFFQTAEVIRRFGDRIAVFIGPGHFIFPGLALGAAGFISTGPELFGAEAARIPALARGAPTAASRARQHDLTRLYRFLMGTATPPAALKCALALLGLPAGSPREPVQPFGAEDAAQLEALMVETGVLAAEPEARARA